MSDLEVYREKYEITEWKGDTVWATKSLGIGWFDNDEVASNRPRETNIMYGSASDDFAKNNSTIRKKRT